MGVQGSGPNTVVKPREAQVPLSPELSLKWPPVGMAFWIARAASAARASPSAQYKPSFEM